MSSDDVAIRVENLSKCYQIYDRPQDRLRQSIMPRLQRLAGRTPTQYFREFWALRDVSFEIRRGETVGIIGRNGSGKSTLLQIICGTLTPTDGEVETNGRVAALLELGSGFNPEFTGRENVYMNAAVLGLQPKEIDARYDDIVAFADIGAFVDQPVKTYSSGMLVRLAFAVAINADPQILVVDEALSVGDELFQRKCFSRIEAIKESGATILFVSHSAQAIVQLCDKAMLMDDGEMILADSARLVTKQYQKLLFAKPNDQPTVRKAILSRSFQEEGSGADEKSDDDTDSISYYAPEFNSISCQRYGVNGGEILEWFLADSSGRKVNVVPSGFLGKVKIRVRFDRGIEDVVFGFHVKSVNGIELAGLSHPSFNEGWVAVSVGDFLEIEWNVKFSFVPATYFFTFGVRSLSEPDFIHRVVDGLIIKVTEKADNAAFGLFDISASGASSARSIKGQLNE